MNTIKLSKAEITEINKLYLAKYRKLENKFIALGPHLNIEAKAKGLLIKTYTTDPNIDGILISEEDMKKIAKVDGKISTLSICHIKENNTLTDKIIILDAIQDPGNMGAIMRSAKAFGYDTIVLGEGCVDIYNEKVIRASQGAIFKLNYVRTNIIDFIENNKYNYYATSVVNGKKPEEVKQELPLALIFGNEGNGINQNILDKCPNKIYIPMQDTESLNVSVAASILMYIYQ